MCVQVSVGNQTKRSRLAPLQNSRTKWGQDFAFAVVLPLRTRPLRLELHQSSGRRRKGRTIARAYIPLANLFPEGCTESAFYAIYSYHRSNAVSNGSKHEHIISQQVEWHGEATTQRYQAMLMSWTKLICTCKSVMLAVVF